MLSCALLIAKIFILIFTMIQLPLEYLPIQ